MNNYRPISVLPLVSKIIERAMQVQFSDFFNRTWLTVSLPIRFSKEALFWNCGSLPHQLYFGTYRFLPKWLQELCLLTWKKLSTWSTMNFCFLSKNTTESEEQSGLVPELSYHTLGNDMSPTRAICFGVPRGLILGLHRPQNRQLELYYRRTPQMTHSVCLTVKSSFQKENAQMYSSF